MQHSTFCIKPTCLYAIACFSIIVLKYLTYKDKSYFVHVRCLIYYFAVFNDTPYGVVVLLSCSIWPFNLQLQVDLGVTCSSFCSSARKFCSWLAGSSRKYGSDSQTLAAALAWFQSYLRGRSQYVRRGVLRSSSVQLICGVPKGSSWVLYCLLCILQTWSR